MIYDNFGGIRDFLKQNLVLQFCRNWNKDVSILTETDINHDQIHHIINNWLDAIFFCPGNIHTKGLLVVLHLGLEGVTKVDTDPKGRFIPFKATPSNDRVLSVYGPWWHSTREQLSKGLFFAGLKNYMENKNEGNENKTIFGDLIVLGINWREMIEIKHYRCRFNYALSKIIVGNGLYDLWKTENPNSS